MRKSTRREQHVVFVSGSVLLCTIAGKFLTVSRNALTTSSGRCVFKLHSRALQSWHVPSLNSRQIGHLLCTAFLHTMFSSFLHFAHTPVVTNFEYNRVLWQHMHIGMLCECTLQYQVLKLSRFIYVFIIYKSKTQYLNTCST